MTALALVYIAVAVAWCFGYFLGLEATGGWRMPPKGDDYLV